MSERSLKATEVGIKIAKNALTTKKLTQEKLAHNLRITRSTVSNFFTGKPVDRQIFVRICEELELNWQGISGQPPSGREAGDDLMSSRSRFLASIFPLSSGRGIGGKDIYIEALVKLTRERCAEDIWKRCGTMRVLDMEQPIALNEIYTDVNILEKLTHNQRCEIDDLLERFRVEEFYRWGLGGQQKRVEGIEAVRRHNKLMILGKPGAGKTTFLKFLAIACIKGDAFTDRVPIFVTLKDFADNLSRPSLLQFLTGEFRQWGVEIEPILKSGKAFLLLDGLDEVRAEYDERVLREIRIFAQRYSQNQIVVTCRIAAKQYVFEQFTEVEVADFDEQQISTFAENWFQNKQIKSEDFLAELKKDRGVEDLATSPLLLTLLCLAFEESGSFPTNRSEL